jgi:tetratricopeptide (TPR) repeat protein
LLSDFEAYCIFLPHRFRIFLVGTVNGGKIYKFYILIFSCTELLNYASLKKAKPGYLALFLFVFSFVLYANSISNDYCLDDEFVTNGNPQVAKGFSGIPEIFTSFYQQNSGFTYGYRPLVKASFAAEYSLFGWNPHISHAINVFLFAVLVLLLFYICNRLFETRGKWFAFFCVLIFAAHPVHTEVVNSLKNRDELLAALFGFSSMLFALRSARMKKVLNLTLALIFLLLALLSKMSSLPFILTIPMALFLLEQKAKETRQNLTNHKFTGKAVYLIPLLAVLSYVLLMTILVKPGEQIGIFISKCFLALAWLVPLFIIFKRESRSGFSASSGFVAFLSLLTLIYVALLIFLQSFSVHFWLILILFAFLMLLAVFGFFPSNIAIKNYLKKMPAYLGVLLLLIAAAGIFSIIASLAPSLSQQATAEEYRLLYFQNPLYFLNSNTDTFLYASASLWFYLKVLFFPLHLGFYYGYDQIPAGLTEPAVWLGSVIHLSLLIVSVIYFLRKKTAFAFGFLFYFFSLSMFINVVAPVAGIVAERLVFIASWGFCIFLVAIIDALFAKRGLLSKMGSLQFSFPLIIVLVIVMGFSMRTFNRNADWKNHQTLFAADIAYLNRSVKANDLMAASLYRDVMREISKGKDQRALTAKIRKVEYYYQRCVEIYPENFTAWNNLGLVRAELLKDFPSAASAFEESLKYRKDDPNTLSSLAFCYFNSGRSSLAIDTYKKAVRLAPDSIRIISSLSNVYFKSGQIDSAISLNIALRKRVPASKLPLNNLIGFSLFSGDTAAAINYLDQLLKLDSFDKNANQFLYNYYTRRGDFIRAKQYKNFSRP